MSDRPVLSDDQPKPPYQFRDGEREKHCRANRDGECSADDCPQLRDYEPATSGRHCPLDHWCWECGEDKLTGDCDC